MEFKRIAQCRFLIGATSRMAHEVVTVVSPAEMIAQGAAKGRPVFVTSLAMPEKNISKQASPSNAVESTYGGIVQFLGFIGCSYTGGTWVCYTVDICSRISQLFRRFHFDVPVLRADARESTLALHPKSHILHHVDSVLECRRISQT